MTSAASYVTRALLVLGAIMNSLIALKYIAGSKASTVESLGPIGKLFKPEYIDRGLGAMAAFAGVAYINVAVRVPVGMRVPTSVTVEWAP